MQNIIIPVDFSLESRAAIDYVLTFFPSSNARVILLHAYSKFNTSEFLISIDDIIEKDIHKKLEVEGEYLLRKSGGKNIELIYDCECNDIVSAIQNAVNTYHADLLVLGSDGQYSWKDMSYMEDGKTLNIIKEVSIPVLIVPYLQEARKPANILFATVIDGIDGESDVHPLIEMTKQCQAHLDIINVGPDKSSENSLNKGLTKTVNGFFKKVDYKLHTVLDSDAYEAIVRFSDEHHSDIICIMYRKHTTLERLLKQSISKKVITNLTKPILTLKHQE